MREKLKFDNNHIDGIMPKGEPNSYAYIVSQMRVISVLTQCNCLYLYVINYQHYDLLA